MTTRIPLLWWVDDAALPPGLAAIARSERWRVEHPGGIAGASLAERLVHASPDALLATARDERSGEKVRAWREAGFAGAIALVTPAEDERLAEGWTAAGADEIWVEDLDGQAVEVLLRGALRRRRVHLELARGKRELEGSRGELQRRNEELRAAFRELAHELRTPLTSAREFLEILLEGAAGPLADRQREFLEISARSCTQIGERIENLLEVARLGAGQVRLHESVGSFAALAAEVLDRLAPRARARGIELRRRLAELPAFAFDPTRVSQVLENLVGNAIKFAPAGSSIDVVMRRLGGRRAELRVVDRGPGIPAEARERLFEAGTQLRRSDAETLGGLGLGLAIAREIARLHRGSLRIEETPGGGATFVLELPFDPARVPLETVSG